jgi:hypothetical protein
MEPARELSLHGIKRMSRCPPQYRRKQYSNRLGQKPQFTPDPITQSISTVTVKQLIPTVPGEADGYMLPGELWEESEKGSS